jgi:hypothetical protein
LPSTEIGEEAVYFDADERVVGHLAHGDGIVGAGVGAVTGHGTPHRLAAEVATTRSLGR